MTNIPLKRSICENGEQNENQSLNCDAGRAPCSLSSCGVLPDLGLGGGREAESSGRTSDPGDPGGTYQSRDWRKINSSAKNSTSDINDEWGLRVVSGLEKQLIWSQNNGRFRLQTLPPNDTNFVFLNKKRII
jgi:hypothetical protein